MQTYGTNIKIEFDDAVLTQLGGLADDYITEVVKRSAFFLQGELGQNAPVDTGRLRTSFEIEGTGDNYHVFTQVAYAYFVNYTAKKPEKKKYIEKSVLSTENNISRIADAIFEELMK